MIPRFNMHVHTSWSDGKNTPEEMILAALAAGCKAIGFSDHSYTAFDPVPAMAKDALPLYREEIAALREKYRGQIAVYCGIEQDFYTEEPAEGVDYVIASVHYIKKDGELFPVDESAEALKEAAQRLYKGDYIALAEDYYSHVAAFAGRGQYTIVGHFDLITKFNEGSVLFDERDPRYIAAARAALEACADRRMIFEINTGAMFRGYRTAPYPAMPLLEMIREVGGNVLYSGDSHRAEGILWGFDTALEAAKKAGFQQMFALTADGLELFAL